MEGYFSYVGGDCIVAERLFSLCMGGFYNGGPIRTGKGDCVMKCCYTVITIMYESNTVRA